MADPSAKQVRIPAGLLWSVIGGIHRRVRDSIARGRMRAGRHKALWWALGVSAALQAIYCLVGAASQARPNDAPNERQALTSLYTTLAALAARLAELERDLATLPGAVVNMQAAHLVPVLRSAHQSLQALQAAMPAQPLDTGALEQAQGQRRELLQALRVQIAALEQQIDDVTVVARELLDNNARVPTLLERLAALFDRLYGRIQACRQERVALQDMYGPMALERVRDNDIIAERRVAQARGMFDALTPQAAIETYEQVVAIAHRIEEQLSDANALLDALQKRMAYLRGTLAMDLAQLLSSLEQVATTPAAQPAGDSRDTRPADNGNSESPFPSASTPEPDNAPSHEIFLLRLALERGQVIADALALPTPNLEVVRDGLVALQSLAAALPAADPVAPASDTSALVGSVVQLRHAAAAIVAPVPQATDQPEAEAESPPPEGETIPTIPIVAVNEIVKERQTIPIIEAVASVEEEGSGAMA
jgi:hypothetical protein